MHTDNLEVARFVATFVRLLKTVLRGKKDCGWVFSNCYVTDRNRFGRVRVPMADKGSHWPEVPPAPARRHSQDTLVTIRAKKGLFRWKPVRLSRPSCVK
jgi:hypothetical protein